MREDMKLAELARLSLVERRDVIYQQQVTNLMAALTEIAHYGVSVPLEMTQAQYDAYAARDMRRIAQAAIDGARGAQANDW